MIQQLSPDQLQKMTPREKDLWWKKNVYRGSMPQLTIRSALTGILLGGILSLTNLYIGIRTGWTLGVGISSVVLSFAAFKILARLGLGREMTILENNAMQSIATSAGYMTTPLVTSLAAYMVVTQQVIPMYQTMIWVIALATLGVFFAFPLKRRFINDEQLAFPEGRAAGIVMDNLHQESNLEGYFKAKILVIGGAIAAIVEILRSERMLEILHAKFLAIPEFWDDLIYKFVNPTILNTPLKDLTIRFDSSIVMIGAGGLMGIQTGISLLFGGIVNYFVLAPVMIEQGIIQGTGFKNITMWALWGGVAMMTTSSLYSFLSKPQMIIDSFKGIFKKKNDKDSDDPLRDIELPLSVSGIGIIVTGTIIILAGKAFFNIDYLMSLIALPLVFVFTIIAINSTGLTSITPVGAMGKLTQLTFSALSPNNVTTNLMTASITAEVSASAANLLMDIKPGYMLGGKPRHQAIGHVIGIFAGAVAAVPVYYVILQNDVTHLISEKLPMPGAQIWKAVAELLTKGLSFLHPTAQWAVLIGGLLGIAFEAIRKKTNNRFPLSGVGVGLAFVLSFSDILAMSLGSILVWLAGRKFQDPKKLAHRIFVENQETACAGVIAGGALIGIIIILITTIFPG